MLINGVTELVLYFPDLEANELPDRDFMLSVLATIKEFEVKKLIEESRKNRDSGNEEDKKELLEEPNQTRIWSEILVLLIIEIHPKFLSALLAAPNTNKGNIF